MTMLTNEVAVLFTVYKPHDEIKATLASLKAQTIPFTLYLVDDGSPYTVDYETLTAGMDVVINRLPKNVGRTPALNIGLRSILAAGHKFVALMDNADTCDPQRFEKQRDFLKQTPEIAIVSTWTRYHYQVTGRTVEAKLPADWQECKTLLRYNAPITHTAMMVRAEVYRAVNLYSEDYIAAEDYAFEHMANALGFKMCNIPEFLMDTLEMTESISGGKRREQLHSRLRLQWRFAEWLNIHTYFGLARTLALLVLPIGVLRKLKSVLK
jgi:glycosyltransferase involved in cell wall biosynthesis